MGFYDDKVKEMMAIEDSLKTLEEEFNARKEKVEIAKTARDAVKADLDAIKSEITQKMIDDGVKHIDKDVFEIKRGSPTKSVQVRDIDKVPDKFVKKERKPVKSDIKKYLESLGDGESVDWAEIVETEQPAKITFKDPE